MSFGFFNVDAEGDIVTLDSLSLKNARAGWVNIGTHAVHLALNERGDLMARVEPRTNEGQPVVVLSVTWEQSVGAGGIDPDVSSDGE
jgi:hypothetical protein